MPAAKQAGTAGEQSLGAAFVHSEASLDPRAERQPSLAKLQAVLSGGNKVPIASPARMPRTTPSRAPEAMTITRPEFMAVRAACIFVSMPPVPRTLPAPPQIASIFRRDFRNFRNQACFRVCLRIRRIHSIHIRQDDKQIGVDDGGHIGGKSVIVADFQFIDRHGVIFVDDRNHPDAKQCQQCIAGIGVAPSG